MRNIFEQYTQPENQLTHALVHTLALDTRLLRPFLRWSGATGVPSSSSLRMVEQRVPGDLVETAEDEASGLPDACFFDDDGWALLVEAKAQAKVSIDQLRRHRRTLARFGFEEAAGLVIAVDPKHPRLPDWCSYREWREVYAWMRRRAEDSAWADRFCNYLERFEATATAEGYGIRGTLTMYDGIRFDQDRPYTYSEGKRLIRLLGDRLQERADLKNLGVDPKGDRRSAITGRGGSRVWDFLPLRQARRAKSFTDFPHLTMDITRDGASVSLTVPNGVKGGFRTALKELELEGFLDLMEEIEHRIRPVLDRSPGSKVIAYAVQRHFRSQRSGGETDARMVADLRTVVNGKRKAAKYQPQWIEAMYRVLVEKRSNIQFGITAEFSYECPVIRSKKSLDLFAKSWVAMRPLLDLTVR